MKWSMKKNVIVRVQILQLKDFFSHILINSFSIEQEFWQLSLLSLLFYVLVVYQFFLKKTSLPVGSVDIFLSKHTRSGE